MLIGYFIMLQMFNITYRRSLNQEAETILNAVAGSFDSAFSNIYDGIRQLAEEEIIRKNLENGDGAGTSVYRELYAVSSKYSKYGYFSIYDAEGKKLVSVTENTYIKEKLPLDWSVLYEAGQNPGKVVVRNARLYEGEKRVEFLRAAMAVRSEKGEITGYIVATVNDGLFDNMKWGLVSEDQGVIYAMDSFQEMVYCSTDSYDEDEMRRIRREMLRDEAADSDSQNACVSADKKYFYYVDYEETSGLYLFYQQPVAALNQLKNRAFTIAVMSAALGLIICIFLSKSVSSFIYQPIKRMQDAIAEIRQGNFKARIKVDSQDELGQLSESFNMMAEHLTDNMERLLARERELSEVQIKMMQAQLNPHFLYNTLDTMKWLGKANQIPEIATISADLAKILRMSISASPEVPLAKEVELAEAYVQIQEIRFADKFEFIVDLPDELAALLVPKQILQPIIENAIIHGLEGRENGRVMVQARQTGEEILKIRIHDDGVGMSREQVWKLNHCEEDTSEQHRMGEERHSIGYYNVNEIIRLNYGDGYGLYTESEEGAGTCIYMTLPVRKGEKDV